MQFSKVFHDPGEGGQVIRIVREQAGTNLLAFLRSVTTPILVVEGERFHTIRDSRSATDLEVLPYILQSKLGTWEAEILLHKAINVEVARDDYWFQRLVANGAGGIREPR
jgi:hypothetical protein